MKIPLIGVTPQYDAEKKQIYMQPAYLEGIIRAGGLPVILPLLKGEVTLLKGEASLVQGGASLTSDTAWFERACEACDGFLFTGGPDIRPELYGEERLDCCGGICDERDITELALFKEAVAGMDKPAFGICRGIQVFNVALGGTLYQDLPSQYKSHIKMEHNQKPPYDVPSHPVDNIPGNPLRRVFRTGRINVNSSHHQGIRVLAPGLESMAVAEDKLIEAVFMPGRRFVWAVQWHPERTPEDGCSHLLFDEFIKACV